MNARLRNIAYAAIKPFLRFNSTKRILLLKNFTNRYEEEKYARKLSPGFTVISGPFKGMKYAIPESANSVFIPKIAGTYEDELHPAIEKICRVPYNSIIDIGSAEGYYAIGFALRIPSAKILAYDSDVYAQFLCSSNAAVNKLKERIGVKGKITAKDLMKMDLSKRSFIICDCEGFELDLFTKESVKNLSHCDLLIELHDCDNPAISATILPLFTCSHKLSLISSKPNKKWSDYAEWKQHAPGLPDALLNERNNVFMQWAYIESLSFNT